MGCGSSRGDQDKAEVGLHNRRQRPLTPLTDKIAFQSPRDSEKFSLTFEIESKEGSIRRKVNFKKTINILVMEKTTETESVTFFIALQKPIWRRNLRKKVYHATVLPATFTYCTMMMAMNKNAH